MKYFWYLFGINIRNGIFLSLGKDFILFNLWLSFGLFGKFLGIVLVISKVNLVGFSFISFSGLIGNYVFFFLKKEIGFVM